MGGAIIDRCVSVDTEYDNRKDPFIGTSTDWKFKSRLFDLTDRDELQALQKIVQNPKLTKIYHPASVDIYSLSRVGIVHRGPFEDTLTAATLIDESVEERKGLKALAVRWLGEDIKPAKKLGWYKRKYRKIAKQEGRVFSYADIPRFILEPYAIEDSLFTEKLWFFVRPRLRKFQPLYDFEKSITPSVVAMQRVGMLVDRAFATKMSRQYEKDIRRTKGEIQAILCKAGIKMPEFNPGSVKQLAWVLEKLDVPITNTTRWGFKTDAETLKEVETEPIVNRILLFRFLSKQKGTYFDSILDNHTSEDDPIAHFLLFQAGTRSGRFSAELVQTIPKVGESRTAHAPKLARKIFIPRPGKRLITVDYRNLQMVLFFHFANATKLIKLANDGWDAHDAACKIVFGKVTPELRNNVIKGIQFGLIFGMGVDKLVRSLKLGYARGAEILQEYHDKVPVREYMEKEISQLNKTGYGVLEIHSDLMDVYREYHLSRDRAFAIVNYKIQGTEAYVMKHAILRVNRMLTKHGFDAEMLMTVHDELIFEIGEKKWFNHVVKKICRTMEDHKTFRTKLYVEPKIGEKSQSWGELEKKDWRKL